MRLWAPEEFKVTPNVFSSVPSPCSKPQASREWSQIPNMYTTVQTNFFNAMQP